MFHNPNLVLLIVKVVEGTDSKKICHSIDLNERQ